MPFNFDSELHCRNAVVGDIPEMLELLRQLFSIESDFCFNPEKQKNGLQMLLHSSNSKIFVAEKQGHVIGMCTLQVLISTAEGGHTGLIEDVIVDEAHRSRGVGTLLLETATECAQKAGLKRLQLLTDKNNATALDFYHKYNWALTNMICVRKLF